jgi:hypothetical protein
VRRLDKSIWEVVWSEEKTGFVGLKEKRWGFDVEDKLENGKIIIYGEISSKFRF